MKDLAKNPDRVLIAAPHFISIPAPIWGPLLYALVMGKNPEARYQGFRAFLSDLKFAGITIGLMAISITYSVINTIRILSAGQQINWVEIIVKSVAVWVLLSLFALWNTISSIRDGISVLGQDEHLPKSRIDRVAANWARKPQRDVIR